MKRPFLTATVTTLALLGCGAPENAAETETHSANATTDTPDVQLWRGFICVGADCDHVITTSEADIKNAHYVVDGKLAKCWSGNDGQRVQLRRFFKGDGSDHLYTISDNEAWNAVFRLGFVEEQSPCWVYPTKSGNLQPLQRFYNGNSQEHLYSTNQGEINSLPGNNGWKYEGITAYLVADPNVPPQPQQPPQNQCLVVAQITNDTCFNFDGSVSTIFTPGAASDLGCGPNRAAAENAARLNFMRDIGLCLTDGSTPGCCRYHFTN